MPEHTKHASLTQWLHAQPVYRLLLLGLIIMALVPLGFLGANTYRLAWDNAWREIHEKHRQFAMNLAAPLKIYVNDHRNMLGALAGELGKLVDQQAADDNFKRSIRTAAEHFHDFRALALVDTKGNNRVVVQRNSHNIQTTGQVFSNEVCFVLTRKTGLPQISNIKPSPLNGKPTLIISQPVVDQNGALAGVLLGELRIDMIEELRSNIHFGEKGHSAIVDKRGHVIVHPNPAWMKEMRDLSDWPIVQEMMAGKTGVTEFYSPFIRSNMVAGYASVPEIGWGIMVPQPRSEIEKQVNQLMRSHLVWGAFGLVLACVIAFPLVRWITRPINHIAQAAQQLQQHDFNGQLPDISPHAPREIRQLATSLQKLVSGLQASRSEVTDLNRSLQHRVDEATDQLRRTNAQLEVMARSDHLTTLPNRRYFETTINTALKRRITDNEPMCIMLIDLDNFKQINDRYGHAAGDVVLVEIASILKNAMRPEDVVARYGGDEFVINMKCSQEIGTQRAQEMRAAIEDKYIIWQGKTLHVTVSIGLLFCGKHLCSSVESLLHEADVAMYEAKSRGRNNIVEISC